MAEYLLELKSVTAGYAKDIDVLRDVSLQVKAAEISGLIGLNGAGKSTLVKTICGFLHPKAGDIFYDNKNINHLEPHHLIDLGICCIPQESSLFPFLTVLSGGQQKQLEFAKAWILQPKLCLVDEPSIGLSPKVAEEVFVWLDRFTERGIGVLLIDHNVRRVVRMSQTIFVLSLGAITASGDQAKFTGDLHSQVKEWLGLNF